MAGSVGAAWALALCVWVCSFCHVVPQWVNVLQNAQVPMVQQYQQLSNQRFAPKTPLQQLVRRLVSRQNYPVEQSAYLGYEKLPVLQQTRFQKLLPQPVRLLPSPQALPVRYLPSPRLVSLEQPDQVVLTEGDQVYTSYYSDTDYPLRVLREPVYVEVDVRESPDPDTVLMLESCWATPTPDPVSLPQWDLLVNGCPYQDDRYWTTLLPVAPSPGLQFPNNYKRFVLMMSSFVDSPLLAPLQSKVFVHCTTDVCHPSAGSCEQRCTRKRRETSGKTISSEQKIFSSGEISLAV